MNDRPKQNAAEAPLRSERGRLWYLLLAMALAGVAFNWIANHAKDFDPDTAAVATEVRRDSYLGPTQVGFMRPTVRALGSFRALQNQGHDVVLWIGASQLYTITDFKSGDRPAVDHANAAALRRGERHRLMTLASGNLNANEMFYLLAAFLQQGAVPKAAVLAYVYDDLDDYLDIRPGFLRDLPAPVTPALTALAPDGVAIIERAISNDLLGALGPQRENEGAYRSDAPFIRLERLAVELVESLWTEYAYRKQVQGWLHYTANAFARSTMNPFTGTPAGRERAPLVTRQPLDRSHLDWNLDGLKSILALARHYRFPVVVYRAPMPDVPPEAGEFPYPIEDFNAVTEEVAQLVSESSSNAFVDLQTLVPWRAWEATMKLGPRLDVFHFSGEGHRLLGEAVNDRVSRIIADAVQ